MDSYNNYYTNAQWNTINTARLPTKSENVGFGRPDDSDKTRH